MVSADLKQEILESYYRRCKKKFIDRTREYSNWKNLGEWPTPDYF